MGKEELPRIDGNEELRQRLLPYCRLGRGEVWEDPEGLHRVGVFDATDPLEIDLLFSGITDGSPGGADSSANADEEGSANGGKTGKRKVSLALQDPPYNVEVGGKRSDALSRVNPERYTTFSKAWIEALLPHLASESHLYIWLGADQKRGFQPLPEFMLLMREYPELESRSFITLRNQRGYGTAKNWMSVRQELLYYTRGNPHFSVQYTGIPKILRGYYKDVGGERKENSARSKSENIRSSNVWVDIQQVFYLMEENVPGAYAQKPLKAIERIIASGTGEGELVADLFSHSGTTLLACEKLGRSCITADLDPIFAELSIRRLERFRETGKTGWQWKNPFPELS